MSDAPGVGATLLVALASLPGGSELLELAAGHEEVDLVGGAVRDLLLSRTPRELDVVVKGDVVDLARSLEARLGAKATVHERFGTALVELDEVRIDLARRRAESYAFPGALPEVRPGDRQEDLERRDFTVNAISLSLTGEELGKLRSVEHAQDDLQASTLRVLHERSFIDDPTRLMRLARYCARLHFGIEANTARLARAAIDGGALQTISGARLGAELRLALAEPDPIAALGQLDHLGILHALHPRLRLDETLANEALALLPAEAEHAHLVLACVLLPLALRAGGEPRVEILSLLDRLEFPRAERDHVAETAVQVPQLIDALSVATSDAQLHAAASSAPIEAVAIAGALCADAKPGGERPGLQAAERWLGEVRHVRLQISGQDLLDAGVPAGPEIGERLRAALTLRLHGEIEASPEAELAAALEAHL